MSKKDLEEVKKAWKIVKTEKINCCGFIVFCTIWLSSADNIHDTKGERVNLLVDWHCRQCESVLLT